MLRKYAADLLCLLLLAGAVGIHYRQAVIGAGCFWHGDFGPQDYPYRHYFFPDALRHGRLPLWCPELNGGVPIYAEGQAAVFYPPNWLLCFGPFPLMFNLNVVFHILFAGCSAYFLARTMGTGRCGSLLAGLCISFNPFFNDEWGLVNYICSAAWIPTVAALFNLALIRRSRRFLVLSALAGAAQHLAGHPYPMWLSVLTVFGIAIMHGVAPWSGMRQIVRVIARLALWSVLIAGIVAVQFLPMTLLIEETRWNVLGESFLRRGMPAVSYVTLLSPLYFGVERLMTEYVPDHERYQFLFIGLAPLLLIPWGVAGAPRKWGVFLIVLGLFGLIVAVDEPLTPLPRLLAVLPPTSGFRNRAIFVMLTILAAALLAGRGLDALLRLRADASAPAPDDTSPPPRSGLPLLAAITLIAAASLLYLHAARNGFLPPPEKQPADPQLAAHRLATLLDGRQRDLYVAVVVVAASLLLIAARLVRLLRPAPFALALLALQTVNVVFFGVPRPALVPPALITTPPAALAALPPQSDGMYRIYSVWENQPGDMIGQFRSPVSFDESARYVTEMLSGHTPLSFRVHSFSSFPNSLRVRRFVDLDRAIKVTGDPQLLGLCNVKYVLAMPDFKIAAPALHLIHTGPVHVYQNAACLPRAYLVRRVLAVDTFADAWRAVTDPARNFAQEAVVEDHDGPPLPALHGNPGTVNITSYAPHRVELDVDCRQDAFLTLADTFYPGWSATVDGRPARVYRTNFLFRGVDVPTGTHRVVFQYDDRHFRIGRNITLVTLLIAAICLVLPARRRTTPPVPHPSS